jgi:hypothetical protein
MLTAIVATASVGGAGGALGAMLGSFLDRSRGREMRDQIDLGGIPLWVRLYSPEWEAVVCDALRLQGARHVHVNDVALDESSRAGGVSQHFAWIDKPLAGWLTGRPAPIGPVPRR